MRYGQVVGAGDLRYERGPCPACSVLSVDKHVSDKVSGVAKVCLGSVAMVAVWRPRTDQVDTM